MADCQMFLHNVKSFSEPKKLFKHVRFRVFPGSIVCILTEKNAGFLAGQLFMRPGPGPMWGAWFFISTYEECLTAALTEGETERVYSPHCLLYPVRQVVQWQGLGGCQWPSSNSSGHRGTLSSHWPIPRAPAAKYPVCVWVCVCVCVCQSASALITSPC